MESYIRILRNIITDMTKNYSQFNETKLKNTVSKFQNDFLNARKLDDRLFSILNNFTGKIILEIYKNLDLYLLSPPKQKAKLASTVIGLILQEGKKETFLQIAATKKSAKKVLKPKQKKKEILSPEECKRIRRIWLNDEDLSQLSEKLMKISIRRTRPIVKPWKLKGRLKVDFVKAIISYIKTQRGWVSLEI